MQRSIHNSQPLFGSGTNIHLGALTTTGRRDHVNDLSILELLAFAQPHTLQYFILHRFAFFRLTLECERTAYTQSYTTRFARTNCAWHIVRPKTDQQ